MNKGFDLETIQEALRQRRLDGWLFAQFHGRDALADRVLGRPEGGLQTRRWYYLVPAEGEPRGLVHAIESEALDEVPGSKKQYRTWGELESGLSKLLEGVSKVAMQYSPLNRLPPIATVDAGTVELVRAAGPEVVSSADLVQLFTATLDNEQIGSHRRAAEQLPKIVVAAFAEVRRRLLAGDALQEYELQQFIFERLEAAGLETDAAPIVAVNANASNPHYAPSAERSSPIQRGDWLLLDIWGKEPGARTIFADITWVAQVGGSVPEERTKVFEVVRRARDAAVQLVEDRYASGEVVCGFEPDRACREVIEEAGYGDAIQHRTGHSITYEIHGSGANLDDFETHDERQLLRRTCFSVEPGIYVVWFGVRAEFDVLIPAEGAPEVTGLRQQEIIPLLAEVIPPLLESAG
ncbi:MAG: M24 family metallopeptidase [Acidobacteriota bacterium]